MFGHKKDEHDEVVFDVEKERRSSSSPVPMVDGPEDVIYLSPGVALEALLRDMCYSLDSFPGTYQLINLLTY